MINLLPPKEKKKLILEKKERLVAVLGFAILIFIICLILILLSIKFCLLMKTDYQKEVLKQAEQKYQTADFINYNNIVQKYNTTLTQLDSFNKKETYFNQALKIVNNITTPKGVSLISFSLNRDDSGKIKVNASGVSDTRDELLAFKKILEEDKEIKNPYLSPQTWISPKNIDFPLTFEIVQNEKQ